MVHGGNNINSVPAKPGKQWLGVILFLLIVVTYQGCSH